MKGNYLTPKQELFVRAYVTCLNASEAAKKAGFSQHSAGRYCLELLMKPHIQDAIQHERRKLRKKMDISAMRAIQEYVSVGLSNIKHLVEQDDTGKISVKDLNDIPDHVASSIASLETKEVQGKWGPERTTKVTLWPKQPALDSIVKMLAYDRAAVDKELAAQANAGQAEQNVIDPRKLDREGWEAFKVLNKKRMEQLSP